MHLYTLQLDNYTLSTDHVEIETIDNNADVIEVVKNETLDISP